MSKACPWHAVILATCVIVIAVMVFSAPATSASSISLDMPAFLKTYAGFTPGDVAKLFEGDVVVKGLDAADSAVAFCAAARIAVPSKFYVDRFRDIESFKRTKYLLQIGRFGAIPTADDMSALTIDSSDWKDLRQCTPGDCDVKLDAAGIETLRSAAVNGRADDPTLAAAVRRHLAAYTAAYLRRGNSVLIQYRDKQDPTSLSTELHHILQWSLYLREQIPALAATIGAYDGWVPPSVEHFLYWSKEKIGPRPVITMTHVLVLSPDSGFTAIASKQIFASHYFTASLGLTLLADVPTPGGPSEMILVYINRSRLDFFDGLFGSLKRSVVRSRARDGALETLRALRVRLERQFQDK